MSRVAVSKVMNKGQVTIPETIRRAYHLHAGEEIEWELTERGTVEIRKTGMSLDALTRILPRPKRALTVDGMEESEEPEASS